MSYKLHEDNQLCDEVKISTAIRWKDSELSGCEYRISAVAQFFKKGHLLHESSWRDIETAWQHAWSDFILKCEFGKFDFKDWQKTQCFQEGCSEKATWEAWIKQEYCVGRGNCGNKLDRSHPIFSRSHRLFCEKHKLRGDCGLEDADSNYEMEPFKEPT